MRASNGVTVELVLQDFSVFAQHARRHRAPHIGIQFMPVESEDLQTAAIQEKSVHIESGLAKARPCAVVMHRTPADRKSDGEVIQLRGSHIPKRYALQAGDGKSRL